MILVICASKCVDKVYSKTKPPAKNSDEETSILHVGITEKSIPNDELEFLHLKKKNTNFEVGYISL